MSGQQYIRKKNERTQSGTAYHQGSIDMELDNRISAMQWTLGDYMTCIDQLDGYNCLKLLCALIL